MVYGNPAANGRGIRALARLAPRQGRLDPLVPPAERATREWVSAYYRELKETRSPFSVQGRIQELGDALRVMTPGMKFAWISRGAGRLRTRARPVKDKRARLQSPARLAELGLQLMDVADRGEVTIEAAMALSRRAHHCLLAYRPLRAATGDDRLW